MGNGQVTSFQKLPDELDAASCRSLLGDQFDQALFEKNSSNGKIPKSKLLELYHTKNPSHILLSCSSESDHNMKLVNNLRDELIKLGNEVYSYDKGSAIVPKLDGRDMKNITASVECASLVVMCISPFYGDDITCFAQSNYSRVFGSTTAFVQMTAKKPTDLSGWVTTRMDEENCKVPFACFDQNTAKKTAVMLSKIVGNASKKFIPETKTTVMPNGDEFTGALNTDGKKEGYGKCVYATPLGRIYEGDFFDDKRHGFGMCIYPNGDVFTGDFCDEKYKGKGVYKYAEGDIFWGAYDKGQRNGYGECKYASGDFYQGEFKDDMYSGKGKYRWADGAVYEGEYFEDQMHGIGTMYNPDGSIAHSDKWYMGDEVH